MASLGENNHSAKTLSHLLADLTVFQADLQTKLDHGQGDTAKDAAKDAAKQLRRAEATAREIALDKENELACAELAAHFEGVFIGDAHTELEEVYNADWVDNSALQRIDENAPGGDELSASGTPSNKQRRGGEVRKCLTYETGDKLKQSSAEEATPTSRRQCHIQVRGVERRRTAHPTPRSDWSQAKTVEWNISHPVGDAAAICQVEPAKEPAVEREALRDMSTVGLR